jgi:hypothetical protein
MFFNRPPAILASAILLAAFAQRATAEESIEFVSEHLPEIAMDNRYAILPLWNACGDGADDSSCFGLGVAYARTHSGTLSMDGPMFTMSFVRTVGSTLKLTGFAFIDDFSLAGGVEQRPLDVLFANPPLTLPVAAEFTGLNGNGRDLGLGFALNGSAHWRVIPWFEWSAGIMWQRLKLSDYRFDYRILGGPDAGVAGAIDFSASYMHVAPFIGAGWPRMHGDWSFTPHVQIAMPLPRRGIEGNITGPGFDLSGDEAANGHGKHFGDPSVTLGFNVTYEPWDLTVDIGSAITQGLFERHIHEGVQHNLMLSTYCTF